jgi:hypothetical protein
VLAAHPVIDRGPADDVAFDLRLVVADRDASPPPEDYRAMLSRSLRRAELPRDIEVVADARGYK